MSKWLEDFLDKPPAAEVAPTAPTAAANTRSSAQTEDTQIEIRPAIAIAIDRQTGAALLVFTEGEIESVAGVADVHRKPFKVRLTAAQRKELRDSLDYYRSLMAKKVKP
jgi:hypothetical protein